MNFTEFLDSITDAQYQVEDKTPKCKKGYKWDKDIGGCIPIGAPKDKDEKSAKTDELQGYNVIGSNGMDGGYALEDGPRRQPFVSSI
jgi:hypothetical protein